MNSKALAQLGQNALAWAKAYTSLKEALIREGVERDEAERQAGLAANMAAQWNQESGEPCPLCGRSE